MSVLKLTLAVSLALHAALGVWVEVRAVRAPPPSPETARDAWRGGGIEVDAVATLPKPAGVDPTPAAVLGAAPTRAVGAVARPRVPSGTVRAKAVERAGTRGAVEPTPARPGVEPGRDSGAVSTPGERESGGDALARAAGSAASFGAVGLPAGVRHLPTAFARAIALANRGDARFTSLPVGVVGEASVTLGVSEDGELGELDLGDDEAERRVAPVLKKLLDNTRLMLAHGRYSVDRTRLTPGVMRVSVRLVIEEEDRSAAPDRDPGELFAIDFEAPRPGKPGHGAFRLNSGRRVVAWVALEASRGAGLPVPL